MLALSFHLVMVVGCVLLGLACWMRQMWLGKMSYRCCLESEADQGIERCQTSFLIDQGQLCDPDELFGRRCSKGYRCVDSGLSPYYGYMNFDNFGCATVPNICGAK